MSPATNPVVDPLRASTGSMQPSAKNNDPRDPSINRHAYTSGHPSEFYHASVSDPRVNRSPAKLEAQPVSSTVYRNPDHLAAKSRTEYAVLPRQRSSTTSAADGRPLPLRLTVSPHGPNRHPPTISSAHGRSSSPWATDQERYLVPASPMHGHGGRRVYNYGHGSDAGRPARPRGDRGEYHASTPRRRYPVANKKPQDIDSYDSYSYTNPREQFEKDSVDHMGRRRVYRRDRPLSLTGAEDYYPPWIPKKDSRTSGPPPSQRGFDRLDRLEDTRERRPVVNTRDAGRAPAGGRSAWGQRDPLSLHNPLALTTQDWDSSPHSSSPFRNEHPDDSHHHQGRRQHDDDSVRRPRHEHTSSLPGPGPDPGLGLGSASLAVGYGDSGYNNLSPSGDWAGYGNSTRRPRSRSRKPSRRRAEADTDFYISEDDFHRYPRETTDHHNHLPPPPPRHHHHHRRGGSDASASRPKDQSPSYMAANGPWQHEPSHSGTRIDDRSSREGRDSSRQASGSSQDENKRSSESPTSPNEGGSHQTQLKSILKQPREKFPEEPNPVREGVAPLKDAHKKGIPPGARWTKIDRRLVNPEALEAGQERFEKRSDCVIVLRVLPKEEIQAYALKTQEIRGKLPVHLIDLSMSEMELTDGIDVRYREYREQQHKEGRRGDSSSGDESYEENEEEDEKPPRQIEAPAKTSIPAETSR